jgi:hypothetical protein
MHIQNKFDELGEILSNGKIIEKNLRMMFRKSRWKGYVITLEAIQGGAHHFHVKQGVCSLENF